MLLILYPFSDAELLPTSQRAGKWHEWWAEGQSQEAQSADAGLSAER